MILETQKSIFWLGKLLSSQTLLKPSTNSLHHRRFITKVRLKWVKNRGLDHIIDIDTELKAACPLKDAIKRSCNGFLTAKSVSDWQKLLGLNVPVLRFCADTALSLDSQEQNIHQTYENDTMERLCRMLMMTKSRTIPFQSLHSLKWVLGLPDNFEKTLVPKYPEDLRSVKTLNGVVGLRLARWHEEFAISALQKKTVSSEIANEYRQFKRGQTVLAFPMNLPRGYGAQKRVRAWMEEFQKLPYISPYEDSGHIHPNSDLMEKRAVGVLHQILSLSIHKKAKGNYLRSLREELNLPHRFTRLFTRYRGIFYVSLKSKTTTVALKEGCQRGSVVDPHPLVHLRKKFYHVMKTGRLYHCKGVNMISQQDILLDNDEESSKEQEESEGEIGSGDECYEETSELEDDSD